MSRLDGTICLYVMVTMQRWYAENPGNCKKWFVLQESFEIFRSIASKLFEIFDEVRLVEEIVFVANFS